MDEHVYEDLIEELREVAATVDGVKGTEKCFVRKAGLSYHVDLHLTVDGNISVKKGHDIAHEVKSKIQNEVPQIANVLIHIEPDDL